jgi:hypothetical protein
MKFKVPLLEVFFTLVCGGCAVSRRLYHPFCEACVTIVGAKIRGDVAGRN